MLSWLAYRLAETAMCVLPPAAADHIAIQAARARFALGQPARRAIERKLVPRFARRRGAFEPLAEGPA
jgi:hypothetical protein